MADVKDLYLLEQAGFSVPPTRKELRRAGFSTVEVVKLKLLDLVTVAMDETEGGFPSQHAAFGKLALDTLID